MIRFKRGLAILLSTCMIGGMMPLPVRAEENVQPNVQPETTQAVKEITAWEWVEKDASDPVLDDNNQLLLSTTEDMPVPYDEITAILPDKIIADSTEVSVSGWSCADYPAEGAYEGSYLFQAELTEGYALAEDADAPEVVVIFDTPVIMAETGTTCPFTVTGEDGGYNYVTYFSESYLTISKAGTYAVSMNAGAAETTDYIEIAENAGEVNLTIENLQISVTSTRSPIIVNNGVDG